MTYNLNIYELYVIFTAIQKSNEENKNKIITFKNEFDLPSQDKSIAKTSLEDILKRKFFINNKRYNWLESIKITPNYITLELNKNLFNLLDEKFIDFVKSIRIKYQYVGTYKILEWLYLNDNEVKLNYKNLKALYSNMNIIMQNLIKENKLTKIKYLNEENEIEKFKIKKKLESSYKIMKEILKYKKEDIRFFISYFEEASKELRLTGKHLKYILSIDEENLEYIIHFKIVQRVHTNNIEILVKRKDIKNYINNIETNFYIKDKNWLEAYKRNILKDINLKVC